MMITKNYFSIGEQSISKIVGDLRQTLVSIACNDDVIAELIELIIAKYSEKHRTYHNLSHIHALLSTAKKYKEKFVDFETVTFAIWFHDIVYNTKRFDNESQSAKIAVEFLSKLNLPEDKIKMVETMILATAKHDSSGLSADGKLFLDLDLAILGQPEEVYQNYSNAIRQEYSFVPWFLYKRSRRKILESFLQREMIYFTDEIHRDFEDQARLNLANEIKELS